MAILDTSKKPFVQDRDEQVFIGIKYPFKKSNNVEGYFESTEQTIDAVNQNEIADGFALWFPFLNIEDIMIDSDQQDQFGRNTINIEVQFALTQNPNILGSVQTTIGE